jgi:Na+/serine symporter
VSWIDLFPIVALVVYTVGGYFSGLIRRFIGLVALFAAFWAATNMGLQAGGILQQTSDFDNPSGKIYGFFGLLVAVLVIVEVATQIAHRQLQIQAIVLNRTLGAAIGALTAILLSVVVTYELEQAATPIGGAQPDAVELGLKSTIHNSLYMVSLTNKIEGPIISLFSPFLPGDPQVYFGPGPVS